MSADPKTELKIKDAAESLDSVRLVACQTDAESELEIHAEPKSEPKSESDFKSQSESQSESKSDSDSKPQSESEPQTESKTDSVSKSQSEPPSESQPQPATGTMVAENPMTHSLKSNYPVELGSAKLLPDLKQVFNCAYFTAATLASAALVDAVGNVGLYAFAGVFAVVACVAFLYSINQRAHISDFNVMFTDRTRRLIRTTALLIPIPIFVAAGVAHFASLELAAAERLYDADLYPQAMEHLNTALKLNPFSEGTYVAISRVHYVQGAYSPALQFAQLAIDMDGNDSEAWTDKARALRAMGRIDEALIAAQKAVDFDKTNGMGWSTLAEVYYDAGNYDKALEAATTHATLHDTEPYSFEIKERILNKMGRTAEAAAAAAEEQRLTALESVQEIQ